MVSLASVTGRPKMFGDVAIKLCYGEVTQRKLRSEFLHENNHHIKCLI